MCVGVGEDSWTSLTNNLKGNISCLVLEFLLDSLQVWEEHQSIMCSNIVDTSYAHTHKHIYTQTYMKMCVCVFKYAYQTVGFLTACSSIQTSVYPPLSSSLFLPFHNASSSFSLFPLHRTCYSHLCVPFPSCGSFLFSWYLRLLQVIH